MITFRRLGEIFLIAACCLICFFMLASAAFARTECVLSAPSEIIVLSHLNRSAQVDHENEGQKT